MASIQIQIGLSIPLSAQVGSFSVLFPKEVSITIRR